jgi:hypothetical protein
MKKETIIAIFFGILLGVTGALLIVAKSRQITTSRGKSLNSAITPSPIKTKKTQSLEITSPKNKSFALTNNIVIKGKASRGSLIVVQSPIKELASKNEKENFSLEFPLALGENVISISVYPQDSHLSPQEKILKIYYLDEK